MLKDALVNLGVVVGLLLVIFFLEALRRRWAHEGPGDASGRETPPASLAPAPLLAWLPGARLVLGWRRGETVPPPTEIDQGEDMDARERLSCDLTRLEDVFGRYSEARVLRRLLRDLEATPALLDFLDGETARLHTRYVSQRKTFEEVLVKAALGNGVSVYVLELQQHLDELILASRREVLANAAAAFTCEHTLLGKVELPLAARREEFLSRFALESEEDPISARD